jgi:hypothetical protein
VGWKKVAVCFVALVMPASTLSAMDLALTPSQIEAALKIARGPESGRAAFHKAYIFRGNDPTVESIEVVTEFRRVVQIAEARIAAGDHLFAQGTRAAQDAIRPWRGHVSVIARLHLPPQNPYIVAPPIDVSLNGPTGGMPRLDLHSQTLFALPSGAPGEPLPVVGEVAEAVFDSAVIRQTSRSAIVRVDGRELARVTIDFSRLE